MKEELSAEIAELRRIHSGLTGIEERTRETVVFGELPFEASHEGLATITESFDIELLIPEAYPAELPWVRETGTRIDCDYRHVFQNWRLCLARISHQGSSELKFQAPTESNSAAMA